VKEKLLRGECFLDMFHGFSDRTTRPSYLDRSLGSSLVSLKTVFSKWGRSRERPALGVTESLMRSPVCKMIVTTQVPHPTLSQEERENHDFLPLLGEGSCLPVAGDNDGPNRPRGPEGPDEG